MRFSALFFSGILSCAQVQAGTLEDVRSNGVLQCGVDGAVAGFSAVKRDGAWSGLPVDFCRALALATIGDGAKVSFTLLETAERVEALQSGEVDVLVSALPIAAITESRDGLLFTEPLYYNIGAKENYAAVVRQGDDQWFVVARWLQKLLTTHTNPADPVCAGYDDVVMLEKNWACSVLSKFADDAWLVKPE